MKRFINSSIYASRAFQFNTFYFLQSNLYLKNEKNIQKPTSWKLYFIYNKLNFGKGWPDRIND